VIDRRTGGKDEELAGPHLAPQKVATAVRSIGKQRPNQKRGSVAGAFGLGLELPYDFLQHHDAGTELVAITVNRLAE
jgi:hypothetical protein